MICRIWNVQGLSNKINEVLLGIENYKESDIKILIETKKKEHDLYDRFYSGEPKNKRTQ